MSLKNLMELVPISERKRKILLVSWDIFEMVMVLGVLTSAIFYMGQVHVCNDIVKADFGAYLGMNDSFIKALNYTPNASEIWGHAPLIGR